MKRLADLGPGLCKWPVREDADGHWHCAEEVARPGLHYCAGHMAIAYPKAAGPSRSERLAMIKLAAMRRGMFRSTPVDNADQTLARIMAESEAAGRRATAASAAVPVEVCKSDGKYADPILAAPPGPPSDSAADASTEAQEVSAALGHLRRVEPVCLAGAEPEPIATGEPIFEHADPAELLVEASYQRDLSPKSVALIRKIALGWDWRKFRPPVVVFTDAGVLIVDGQHTTIAAASRGLASIPIQIVEAPEVKARAEAFIGLNRDRLQVTPVQLHHAAVAAGDETALTIEQVCQRAGVTIVRTAWGSYKWKPGETMAVNAIRDLIDRRGAMKARLILQALAEAGCAPVAAHEIKAAEHLFTNEDFAAELDPLAEGGASELANVVRSLGNTADKDAKMFAATHCVPYWKGLAAVWFKKCKKRRKAA